MPNLDKRLINVTLNIGGRSKIYNQELHITARGTKYGNGIFNECTVTLANLTRSEQDYILTETSPYNRNYVQKLITVDAGRVSYGTSRIFSGNVFTSKPTQPPDISVILRCIENGFNAGNIIAQNQNGSPLSVIAEQVAVNNGLTLIFEATDKTISNYTYTGAANMQVDSLSQAGGVDVYQDGTKLIVKNRNAPLRGVPVRTLSLETGMIGIPEFIEYGIRAKFLLDNITTVGSGLNVISKMYPAVNGFYTVYKLDFDIASREVPFYYIAEAIRQGQT